jgi:transmembrane sensor
MDKYTSYSAEELAMEPSFQQWVHRSDPEAIRFWNNWLRLHPDRRELVDQAIALVALLHMPKQSVPDWEVEEAIREVRYRMEAEAVESEDVPLRSIGSPFRWWRVAAVIAALVVASAVTFLFVYQPVPSEYATQYGEMKEVTLPDGSRVTLSGNSRLRVSKAWMNASKEEILRKPTMNREVWLEGMAYFSVKHLSRSQTTDQPVKFIVHAAEVNVEVIGTEFNVSNRSQDVRVVLNSGQIQLRIGEEGQRQQLVLKPGDLVAKEKKDGQYQVRHVNPEQYSSWKQNEFQFDHTSLAEVAEIIEQAYGYPVVIQPESLKRREVTGTIQNKNLPFILQALSAILDIEASRNGKQIILYDPNSDSQ